MPASNLRRACLPRAYAPPVSDTYTQDVDALSLPASAGSRSVYLLIPVYAAHIPAATLSSANHQTARHATRRGTCCAAEPPSTSSWLCYSNSNSRVAPPRVTPPFPQHTHTELRGASVDDDAFGGAAASSPPRGTTFDPRHPRRAQRRDVMRAYAGQNTTAGRTAQTDARGNTRGEHTSQVP